MKDLLPKLETDHSNQTSEHTERLLFIYHTLVEHRKGVKITKPQSVCEVHMYGFVCTALCYIISIVIHKLLRSCFALPVASPAGPYSRSVLLLLQFVASSDLILSARRKPVPTSEHDPRTGEKGVCACVNACMHVYTKGHMQTHNIITAVCIFGSVPVT